MRDHKVVERDERSQGSKEMRRDNAEERERDDRSPSSRVK